jgi:hypothetical protein
VELEAQGQEVEGVEEWLAVEVVVFQEAAWRVALALR